MKKHLSLIAILLSLNTYFLIGDFQVRLANISSDDGLVAKAYVLSFPERFVHDALAKLQNQCGLASAMNWLPAELFKHFNVNPDFFALIFVYLQNILLGIGVFLVSVVLTGRRDVSWVSVALVTIAKPHWNNLASYGDLDWMAYAGHLAIPFILLSAYFLLKRKLFWGYSSLVVAAAIHPSLAIFFIAMLFVYFIFFEKKEDQNGLIKHALILILLAGCAVLPTKIMLHGIPEISREIIFQALTKNGHVSPALSALGQNLEYIILLLCLSAFGLYDLKTSKSTRFLLAVWFAATTLCLMPFLGYLLKHH